MVTKNNNKTANCFESALKTMKAMAAYLQMDTHIQAHTCKLTHIQYICTYKPRNSKRNTYK